MVADIIIWCYRVYPPGESDAEVPLPLYFGSEDGISPTWG